MNLPRYVSTVASTVGLPRESNTCRPVTDRICAGAICSSSLLMTEYGSSAFCLTAALTTFSTAFLMLFFLRYSCGGGAGAAVRAERRPE